MIPRVSRLVVNDFRSYESLDLKLDVPSVVLTGENGAGKTNLLEALSLFAAGRGLRRADAAQWPRQHGKGSWAVAIEWGSGQPYQHFGTGIDQGETNRRYRFERQSVASARPFADHLRIIWLTPAMDGLFVTSPAERRRFLDRLVLAIDADHGTRVAALEKALRNRNRLLENSNYDRVWASALEREIAELGVAVAAIRRDIIGKLNRMIEQEHNFSSPFPYAQIQLKGDIEDWLQRWPAIEVESRYAQQLEDNRALDRQAGRTLIGAHASDLLITFGQKQIEARRASSGEQKALLIGLILAHARLVHTVTGQKPLLLLDEITAHLDLKRREALYELLQQLAIPLWMSGADASVFRPFKADKIILEVADGVAKPTTAA